MALTLVTPGRRTPPRTTAPTVPTALALRPYQREALDAITVAFARSITGPLVALPTGTGKTVVFAHLARQQGGCALIVAHRDELLRQAADKVRLVDPTARVGIVKADEDDHQQPIVVANVQTLARPRRRHRLPRDFVTLVVDEAHHMMQEGYLSDLRAVRMRVAADLGRLHEKALATATMARINRAVEDLRQARGVA